MIPIDLKHEKHLGYLQNRTLEQNCTRKFYFGLGTLGKIRCTTSVLYNLCLNNGKWLATLLFVQRKAVTRVLESTEQFPKKKTKKKKTNSVQVSELNQSNLNEEYNDKINCLDTGITKG